MDSGVMQAYVFFGVQMCLWVRVFWSCHSPKETKLEVHRAYFFYMEYISVQRTDWPWQRALYALHEGVSKNMQRALNRGCNHSTHVRLSGTL